MPYTDKKAINLLKQYWDKLTNRVQCIMEPQLKEITWHKQSMIVEPNPDIFSYTHAHTHVRTHSRLSLKAS